MLRCRRKSICYRKRVRCVVIFCIITALYLIGSVWEYSNAKTIQYSQGEQLIVPYFTRHGSFARGLGPEQCDRFLVRNPETVPTLEAYYCDTLRYCGLEDKKQAGNNLTLCSCFPDTLHGPLHTNFTDLLSTTWSDLEYLTKYLHPGGHWTPAHCAPRRRVSVIIPYRDRERHLRAFLAHYHPILQRQQLEYKIFVVEQDLPYIFNKASLMNAGFLEAMRAFQADCVLFIDVDTLAERDDNIVICGDRPVHWAAYVNRTHYEHIVKHFGAAVLLTVDQFQKVNGYSNVFWGWGGEDDNFLARIQHTLFGFDVGPREISRYVLLGHSRDDTFQKNTLRYTMTSHVKKHPKYHSLEGVNTVNYKVLSVDLKPLYTRILIELLELNLSKMPFSPFKSLVGISYKAQVTNRARNQFVRVTGRCAGYGDVRNRHFKSKITCKFLCDLKKDDRVCVGFEYHEPTDSDAFCVLLEGGCAVVDTDKDSHTVYMVKSQSSMFRNIHNVTEET